MVEIEWLEDFVFVYVVVCEYDIVCVVKFVDVFVVKCCLLLWFGGGVCYVCEEVECFVKFGFGVVMSV